MIYFHPCKTLDGPALPTDFIYTLALKYPKDDVSELHL